MNFEGSLLVVGAFSKCYENCSKMLLPPLHGTDLWPPDQELVVANLRCYSCAPCTEFDYSSGWSDPGRWEMDCPLDRYCFKITGQVSYHCPSCIVLLLDFLPFKAKSVYNVFTLQTLILSWAILYCRWWTSTGMGSRWMRGHITTSVSCRAVNEPLRSFTVPGGGP